MGFQLTSENYYSDIANYEYMSVSQFKDFAGTYGKLGCEECAMAKIRGKYKEPDRTALLEGSYVDSFYEGTLDKFKEEHAELFRQDGELKANFIKAEKAIARSLRDPLFQEYMSGEKQVIMTGELFGSKWKIKMDSYHPFAFCSLIGDKCTELRRFLLQSFQSIYFMARYSRHQSGTGKYRFIIYKYGTQPAVCRLTSSFHTFTPMGTHKIQQEHPRLNLFCDFFTI